MSVIHGILGIFVSKLARKGMGECYIG